MAAVGVIARWRRSGAPTGSGDDLARGAWRCRGRCGIGSAGSCAWGAPPRRIRADLVAEGVAQAPCTETIYQAIYTGALEVRPSKCLRTRRCRRRCRQGRNPRSRSRGPNIAERPAAVEERAVAGHWEVDQIIGANNRSSMIWLTERQSRYLIPITMPDGYDADAVFAGLVEGLDRYPRRTCGAR